MNDYESFLYERSSIAHQHIADLLDVLEQLLALPELCCFVQGEPFGRKEEAIANARTVRAAVFDDQNPLADALERTARCR